MIALVDFRPVDSKWLALLIVSISAACIYALLMPVLTRWCEWIANEWRTWREQ